jgi:hypothetical protein
VCSKTKSSETPCLGRSTKFAPPTAVTYFNLAFF